jgi:transposase-like protein
MAVSFKGAHFPQDIILMGVRWYVAYPLSYRHVEELMQERGVPVDHATIQRWVVKDSPALEAAFHHRKRSVWVSWRMDETYIRIKGQWYYLYRAVDKTGQTIDFLLTKHRDERAAKRFLTKAIRRHGVPAKITIDGSAANAAAIRSYNTEHGTAIAHCREGKPHERREPSPQGWRERGAGVRTSMASWAQGVGHSVLRNIHHLWGTTQDQFASRINSVDTSH